MESLKPVVISIGGWDPCGGAGLAADIKSFEQNNTLGMGVCSCITCQTDNKFESLQWTDLSLMKAQLLPLLEQYDVKAVKFGIMSYLESVITITNFIKEKDHSIPIIWDPVIKASAGYAFHKDVKSNLLNELMQSLTLVTPNLPEAVKLFGSDIRHPEVLQQRMIKHNWGAILIKGGHADNHANDILISQQSIECIKGDKFKPNNRKHGSGCVISAAIASNLAKGLDLSSACTMGKRYVEQFLLSSPTLLGYHKDITTMSEKHDAAKRFEKLMLIIPQGTCNEVIEKTKAYIEGGGRWVQLRLKESSQQERLEAARQLVKVCQKSDTVCIINDSPELAIQSAAHGVHLGKNDISVREARMILGSQAIIGGTANTLEDMINLANEGVDYIGLGPFRFTTTKKKLSPVLGIEGYERVIREFRSKGFTIPVTAIGGILPDDISPLMETGVDGIAVSGCIGNAAKPSETTATILNELTKHIDAPQEVIAM